MATAPAQPPAAAVVKMTSRWRLLPAEWSWMPGGGRNTVAVGGSIREEQIVLTEEDEGSSDRDLNDTVSALTNPTYATLSSRRLDEGWAVEDEATTSLQHNVNNDYHNIFRDDTIFGHSTLLTNNTHSSSRAFNEERARWLKYFDGMERVTVIEDVAGTDKSHGPDVYLVILVSLTFLCMLPLLQCEDWRQAGAARLNQEIQSLPFQVVVALSLGSCILTSLELCLSLYHQYQHGPSAPDEFIHRLTLVRFLLLCSYMIRVGLTLSTSLSGTINSNLYVVSYYHWFALKFAFFIYLAKIHLTHWSYFNYTGYFMSYLALNFASVYVNITPNYDENFKIIPLIQVVHILYVAAFLRSVWRAVVRGHYTTSTGDVALPAIVVLVIYCSPFLVAAVDHLALISILSTRAFDFPLWVVCFHVLTKTLTILVVAILPIKIAQLVARKTRNHIRTIMETEDPFDAGRAAVALRR